MNAANCMSESPKVGVFLQACLEPFRDILISPEVTDIFVNAPGELWVEKLGGEVTPHRDERLTASVLQRFAQQLAALTHQGINREHPLLSSSLPDGSRIQIVGPPATRGPMALAIRRHLAAAPDLSTYESAGLFNSIASPSSDKNSQQMVRDLITTEKHGEALRYAVAQRMNILISGGTSTGKTTFLNALLREVPAHERLIFIEDTPELASAHRNQVGLVAVRGELGEARVSADDLLSASLRMRPDRIILGELRGAEAFTFLRAVNSGHPGSMTTIHADTPLRAIEQLVLLALQAGTSLSREDIRHYVSSTIDVFIQLGRRNGRRQVDAVVVASQLHAI